MTKWIYLFLGLFGFLLVVVWMRPNLKPVPIIPELASLTPRLSPKPHSLSPGQNNTPIPLIVADGVGIRLFASDLNAPRDIEMDSNGTILVSLPKAGRVVALPDKNGDGRADEVVDVITGLNQPHGIVNRCDENCKLWVAETDGVLVYDYDPASRMTDNPQVLTKLPTGGRHWTRSLLFHPTNPNVLLISVGSSCDVCEEQDWRRASVLALDLNTNELQPYVTGMRNGVFLAINPVDETIWVTEMGRDRLGDDLPPEELNVLQPNIDYGWPYCYGKQVHDTQFDKEGRWIDFCATTEPAAVTFQAHSAPLGLAFIPDSWPEIYVGDLLVAYHGSWNRSVPTGYKIARFTVNDDIVEEVEFVSGWLQENGDVLGRPVDVFFSPDGNLYVSDDEAGAIYLIQPLDELSDE